MGAGVNKIGGSLIVWHPQNFSCYLFTYVENFIFKLEWLKNLKDIFQENFPIAATELVLTLSFLSILNVSYA